MKFLFVILVVMLSSPLLAGEAKEGTKTHLSLHEALSIAYENNPRLKGERARFEGDNENLWQAYANFLPNISANYNISRKREELSRSGNKTFTKPISRSLSLSQPIFKGGEGYYSIKLAKSIINSAKERLLFVEQEVLSDAVAAYMDVVQTTKILALSKNNQNVLSEQLQATKDRFLLGETTITDVEQSKSRLARAESDKVRAEGNHIAAIAQYRYIYNVKPMDNIAIPKVDVTIPQTYDDVKKLVIKNNHSLKNAQYNVDANKYNINIARSDLMPNVDVNAQVNRDARLGTTRSSSNIEDESIALNVSIPLYQSGAEYSRIRQAKKNLQNSQHILSDTRNDVYRLSHNAWQKILTTEADVKANQASVKAATLALDGVKDELDVGSRTTLDVLDAEQELFVAKVNLITAQRNQVVAAYNLHAVMGSLNAKDLGLKIDLYNPDKYTKKMKYKFIGY